MSPDIADIRVFVVNLTSSPDKGQIVNTGRSVYYPIPQPSGCDIVASLSFVDIGDMLVVNLTSGPDKG